MVGGQAERGLPSPPPHSLATPPPHTHTHTNQYAHPHTHTPSAQERLTAKEAMDHPYLAPVRAREGS